MPIEKAVSTWTANPADGWAWKWIPPADGKWDEGTVIDPVRLRGRPGNIQSESTTRLHGPCGWSQTRRRRGAPGLVGGRLASRTAKFSEEFGRDGLRLLRLRKVVQSNLKAWADSNWILPRHRHPTADHRQPDSINLACPGAYLGRYFVTGWAARTEIVRRVLSLAGRSSAGSGFYSPQRIACPAFSVREIIQAIIYYPR